MFVCCKPRDTFGWKQEEPALIVVSGWIPNAPYPTKYLFVFQADTFFVLFFYFWKLNFTYSSHKYHSYSMFWECSRMFRNVPECSGMFRNVLCSWFYRRPSDERRVDKIVKNVLLLLLLFKLVWIDIIICFLCIATPTTSPKKKVTTVLRGVILTLA